MAKKNQKPKTNSPGKSRASPGQAVKRITKKTKAAGPRKTPQKPAEAASPRSVHKTKPVTVRQKTAALGHSRSNSHLDELPQRHETHELCAAAEDAFEAAIKAQKLFLIPRKDQYDYGSDYQIEACDGKSVTNLRAHVQLKGDDCVANQDGSVSVTVRRSNLNYLLAQSDALYVCWHAPTARLLVAYAAEVYLEYEHQGSAWRTQAELTVRFRTPFDQAFQRRFHSQLLAAGRSTRDRRLEWIATPPEKVPEIVSQAVPLVEVPVDPSRALEVLQHLYAAGHDQVISCSFARFEAALQSMPGGMIPAYLAEINLGINSAAFDRQRVRRAVDLLDLALTYKLITPTSARYCQGNAWLALRELPQAKDCYLSALQLKSIEKEPALAAQCLKNLGSALEGMGDHRTAYQHYLLALERDPNLAEAHMAVAICGLSNGLEPREALQHLDAVSAAHGSAVSMSSVQGWRVEVLFQLGESVAAFRELQALVSVANRESWIWPYCAAKVADHGRASLDSARLAINFWRDYLQANPGNPYAQAEQLLCFAMLHSCGIAKEMTFEKFRATVERLSGQGLKNLALLWDRAGHWSQDDGDWTNAEPCFRNAYELEGGHYGYCLGVALNFLARYDEALPLLQQQADSLQPDAMSWFQVGVARAGTADFKRSLKAYQRAVELDSKYVQAWFNLGSMYLRNRDLVKARAAWQEVLRLAPDHELAKVVREQIPRLLGDD
jgi:tetratricopeptide (TPR) repeat protein